MAPYAALELVLSLSVSLYETSVVICSLFSQRGRVPAIHFEKRKGTHHYIFAPFVVQNARLVRRYATNLPSTCMVYPRMTSSASLKKPQ